MLKLGHKNGGRVTRIVAIAHSSWKGRAEWHFVGFVEWDDGSHKRHTEPREVDIPQYVLTSYGNDRADLEKAMHAMNEYLRINGEWGDGNGSWTPYQKSGRVDFVLE